MDRTAIRQKEAEDALEPELRNCYDNHLVLLNLITSAEKRTIADKSEKFSHDHGIAIAYRKGKVPRRKEILIYFDKLRNQVIDNAFVEMVATFERIAFTRMSDFSLMDAIE